MSYIIKDLLIETSKDDPPHFTFDNESPVLKNLSKVNIFVGSNNSGKSLLLRSIAYYKDLNFFPNNNLLLEKYLREVKRFYSNYGYADLGLEDKELNHLNLIFDTYKCFITNDNKSKKVQKINSMKFPLIERTSNYDEEQKNNKLKFLNERLTGDFFNEVERIIEKEKKDYPLKKVYIPTLRGLRNPILKGIIKDFEKENINNLDSVRNVLRKYTDLYRIRTESDYFNTFDSFVNKAYSSNDNNFSIFTGLNLYEEVKKLLLGNLSQRKKIKDFENFLSKRFFDNQEIVLIPSYDSDVLHIKIGSEKERAIYNLGDGIQSIIVMTFPLFQYQDDENVLVFIEEPELYIHAGLQKTLIKTFSSDEYFKNHQFFLVSHSNHIIDQINESDEISIYSVKKELSNEGGEEITPTFKVDTLGHGNKNALSLLGITSSSVYLSNCTIWVEGVTDKLYLSKYIEEYIKNTENEKYKKCKNFKEGLHYSFTYTAGDSIVHFNFEEDNDVEEQNNDKVLVDKLCSRSMVIVDSDDNKNPNRKKELRKLLKKRFVELKVIEMENLLSIDVIKKVIKENKKFKDATDDNFNKIENECELHRNIRLGTLIDKHLLGKELKKTKKKFSSYDKPKNIDKTTENLTVNNKVDFCKTAIRFITYENMTNESKNIVKKILDFILENNH